MSNSLNYRDLFIRCFVIAITSWILTFTATNSNLFDLHFKIRRAQSTSQKIQIIQIEGSEQIDRVIQSLLKKDVQHIFVSQFYSETKHKKVTPFTTDDKISEYLNLDFSPNTDGIVRQLKFLSSLPNFSPSLPTLQSLNINFRGPPGTFNTLDFYDIAESNLDLSNKIIILKTKEVTTTYTTPIGLISEAEMVANALDNFIERRFIPNAKLWLQFTLLALSLLIVTTLLIYLPSTLALISTFVFTIFYTSLSLWFFDNYYIWTPIFTPLIQTTLTFLLISNYKSTLNEKTKWNLEKESALFNEVEEMKTNFLSLFSHDLKTPLAKIIGITDTLISKTKDSETLKDLEKIHLSTRDLEKYIKRILKMSQVQSKNISLNKKPEDINTLIERSIKQNQLFAAEKNISFKKELSPLFMIDIDASLVQEVIINLIENAIKYSPADSLITLKSEENKEYIKVSVLDQGQGIPKQAQDSIWEKYYRFDSSQSGYGLGLFLSRYVINLHGGQVFLNSKENSGSEFGFILPINEDQNETT